MKRISRSTSQKFIIYAIPVSIIGILALLTFTLLVPKIKDIVENYKQLDDKKLQLNKLKKKTEFIRLGQFERDTAAPGISRTGPASGERCSVNISSLRKPFRLYAFWN